MRLPLVCLTLLLATGALPARAEPIKLKAADGIPIYAEVWRAPDRPDGSKPPVIIAFHQAGSNHAEYAPIAPRLVAAGFTVLAIDQRAGGEMFGTPNRTVAAINGDTLGTYGRPAPGGDASGTPGRPGTAPEGNSFGTTNPPPNATKFGIPERAAVLSGSPAGFRAVLPDLEAALLWGHQAAAGAPVIAMGSSYSAALVFLLAARHPGALAALVAFSPGEYLDGPSVVHDAAERVEIPVLVDSAKAPDEIAAAKSLLDAVPGAGKVQIVPRSGGVHGASTLRADKDPAGAEENWRGLLAFLAPFAKP